MSHVHVDPCRDDQTIYLNWFFETYNYKPWALTVTTILWRLTGRELSFFCSRKRHLTLRGSTRSHFRNNPACHGGIFVNSSSQEALNVLVTM